MKKAVVLILLLALLGSAVIGIYLVRGENPRVPHTNSPATRTNKGKDTGSTENGERPPLPSKESPSAEKADSAHVSLPKDDVYSWCAGGKDRNKDSARIEIQPVAKRKDGKIENVYAEYLHIYGQGKASQTTMRIGYHIRKKAIQLDAGETEDAMRSGRLQFGKKYYIGYQPEGAEDYTVKDVLKRPSIVVPKLKPKQLHVVQVVVIDETKGADDEPVEKPDSSEMIIGKIVGLEKKMGQPIRVGYHINGDKMAAVVKPDGSFSFKAKELGGEMLVGSTDEGTICYLDKVTKRTLTFPRDASYIVDKAKLVEVTFDLKDEGVPEGAGGFGLYHSADSKYPLAFSARRDKGTTQFKLKIMPGTYCLKAYTDTKPYEVVIKENVVVLPK